MAQIQMFSGIVNSPITTLSVGIDNSVTTISITDISKVPVAPNLLTISGGENAETIKYTGISGNDLTGCTRGLQGNASSWNMGVSVMRAFTAYDHDTFKNNIEDHVGNTTTPHGADTASTASKIALRDASGNLTAKQIISDVAIGTAPIQVTSTTKVTNLNVEQVDGHDAGTSAGNVLVLDGSGLVPVGNVPSLSFSKITSGLPTTIEGYGITDAVPISHIANTTLFWQAVMTSGTQSLASGVATTIAITETISNINVSLASNVVTILNAGNYDIDFRVYCDSVPVGLGNYKAIKLNKNGVVIATNATLCDTTAVQGTVLALRHSLILSQNDQISFTALSIPSNVLVGNTYAAFTIRRMG